MIPISPLLILYIAFFLLGAGVNFALGRLNVRHLKNHGHTVPAPFRGYINGGQLSKIIAYATENEGFHTFTSCIHDILFLCIILSGLLPTLLKVVENQNLGPLGSGIVFFAILAVAQVLFSLPFNYYKTFVIEQRYGFNTSTFRMWVVDIVKGMVVGSIIGGLLLLAVLSLIEYGGALWWLWAWLVFFAFQLLLIIIYPTVIAPWFNKFLPLEDEALEAQVKDTMLKCGLSVKGVFKMDAGKRSRHTNAFLAGLGKTKRIVLFDTLLASHNHNEIVAILAHEVGHWKKRHGLKNILLLGVFSLCMFYLGSILMNWFSLYKAFGFGHVVPYIGLFLVGVLWEAGAWFLEPFGNAISRKFEREADSYAAKLLQKTTDLTNALKGLARDNLSNLFPHPLYAWFYYSHPPLLERIRYLEPQSSESRGRPRSTRAKP